VQRWELSSRLRELRREAGLTIEQVAQELMCSPAKISRMETGLRSVQLRDIRDLAKLYRLSQRERDDLAELAQGARRKSWYDEYDLRDDAREYYGLEHGAADFRWVEPLLIPGLIQHQGYTTELLKVIATLEGFGDLRIDDQVKIRSRRKQRLLEGQARYRFLVADGALRDRVGDARVMADQMEYLLELASLPNVSVRVLRSDRGLGPAIVGQFILMSFDSGLPDLLHREVAELTATTTEPKVVQRYADGFSALELGAESVNASLHAIEDARHYWLKEL
jgi:transcriptional regulator with XRE-family HTH domain